MSPKACHRLPLIFAASGLLLWLVDLTDVSRAGGFRSPEECLAYAGDAHLNCLYAYIEIQQEKITKLEQDLTAVRSRQAELEQRADRQASIAGDLQRRLNEETRPPAALPPIHMAPYFGYAQTFGPYPYPHRFYYGYRFFGPCYGPWFPCW